MAQLMLYPCLATAAVDGRFLAFIWLRAVPPPVLLLLWPLLLAVAVTSSYGFATPLGYQTNLMVYGPGGYKFTDYLKIGIPLDIICWSMTVAIVPLVWDLDAPVPVQAPPVTVMATP